MTTSWPVAIDVPDAKAFADFTGVEADLKIVIEFCDRLVSIFEGPKIDGLLMEALSTAAVIRYARCFASGVRTRLSDEVLVRLTPEERLLHDSVYALRQRHYAHSVNTFEENRLVAWVSDDPDDAQVRSVAVQHGRISSLGLPTARGLADLTRRILAVVQETLAQEGEKVLLLARKLPYEELRNREMPEPFAPKWSEVDQRR